MHRTILVILVYLSYCNVFGQTIVVQQTNQTITNHDSRYFSEIRGKNAISVAVGTSVLNGDLNDPLFEIYTHIGYKRFLGSYVNVNFGYQKFNLAYKDNFNEGFMSFDLNFEFIPFPHLSFTPFVFAGGGLNAANYFTRKDYKVQGGGGLEVLVTPTIGIKLFAEYNYMFTDELDGIISGDANDAFWRAGFGLNFYFGNRRKYKKIKDNVPTVINSNPIIHLKN